MRSQRFLQIILGFGSDLDIDSPLLQISIFNFTYQYSNANFNNLQSASLMGNANIPLISSLIEYKKPRTTINLHQPSIINRTINNAIGLKNVIDQQVSKKNEINSKKNNKNQQNIMRLQMKYSMQERLSLMQCIQLDQQQFTNKWGRLELLLKDVVDFKLMFLQPKNAEGQRLLRNGCFLVLWMKILQQNPCININMVCKNVREKYLSSVVEERVQLLQYLDEHKKINKVQMNKDYTLKRNGIKKGERYVSFADEKPMSKEQRMKLERENKLQKIRSEVGYLLDYFQINDIYLLSDVTMVGVIKQIEDQLAIIVVKPKSSIKQVTCIGVLPKFKSAESGRLLKSIERQYENVSYLDLNGLETSQLWINSLQTEKLS